jgi:transforming growth factor-beta-induced protein
MVIKIPPVLVFPCKHHIVSGKIMSADLTKLNSTETLQEGSLTIGTSGGMITVDDANVIVTDIECSNGVIHIVDTVMLPPA